MGDAIKRLLDTKECEIVLSEEKASRYEEKYRELNILANNVDSID
jgi:hypothetical protein